MTVRTATPSTHPYATLAAALHRGAIRLRMAHRRRAVAAELSGLSDRDLADIGLARTASPAAPFGLPTALYR